MFTFVEMLVFFIKYFIILPSVLFALFHGLGKLLYFLYPYVDDSNRSIEEIVSSRGFLCEDHEVTTVDGYILTLHRIVHPENVFTRKYKSKTGIVSGEEKKPPLLLQHGMFSNSRAWLVASDDGHLGIDLNRNIDSTKTDPKKIGSNETQVDNTLAFALVKAGYDVFLGNSRGNLYSMKHERLDPFKDDDFWNCSMSELVKYDIPACIDYILTLTGHQTIGYIGFSQGTTSMLALMSQEKRYNEVVKPFIAMAPVANARQTNPFNLPEEAKVRFYRILHSWCRSKSGPFFPLITETVSRYFCSNFHFRSFMNRICFNIFALSSFPDSNRTCIYTVTTGSHCMSHNLAHVLQNVQDKHFRDYDYGKEINVKKYGSEEAPIYDLKKITNRFICFFYSNKDIIVRFEDVIDLKKKLSGENFFISSDSNSQLFTTVPLLFDYNVPEYNHLDFQLAQNLGSLVNNRIISLLNSTMKRRSVDGNDNCVIKETIS